MWSRFWLSNTKAKLATDSLFYDANLNALVEEDVAGL